MKHLETLLDMKANKKKYLFFISIKKIYTLNLLIIKLCQVSNLSKKKLIMI
jgi:hypothetical protein